MPVPTHLRALQALEMAIREGSLKAAAERLGITPAAVGQRVRALENYLGTDLLLRGRSGLQPTPELDRALRDLRDGFAALERAIDTLDFQRVTEIHVVADPDWAELWLAPRLPDFRAGNPNILFCINGEGDVPTRLGAPDIRVAYGGPEHGETLFTDRLLPVSSHDNLRRLADWDDEAQMEGLPLLHVREQIEQADRPGWKAWFARYGHRRSGEERGVLYKNMRMALEAMRDDVGFVICGLGLAGRDIAEGRAHLPFPEAQNLIAPMPYRMKIREQGSARPQMVRFLDWLRGEASDTARMLAEAGDAAASS